ncbi:MAG: hypothetical protein HZA25_02725 [Candidatus Niyogibacteria bacterium]|nr:hypothetical protein [Candidatus Niyogibacteria bacterium]
MLRERNTFYCFSPEVMLITFAVEILLAVYTFIRYRRSAFGAVASAILVFLAVFQAAEYQVCTTNGTEIVWARIGMIAITLLPILGLHLIMLVTNTERFLRAVYLVAIVSVLFFALLPTAVSGPVCGGNYVILRSDLQQFFHIYSLYYFGLLFLGIWKVYELIARNELPPHKRAALYWMFFGYLSFILPTAIIYGLYESTLKGIPSIMCGFAIVFALILALRVVPLYHKGE